MCFGARSLTISNNLNLPNKIKDSFPSKFPKFCQWKKFLNVLSRKERNLFFLFLCLAFVSTIVLDLDYYFKETEIFPASGGEYKEGLIGQPRFINPLYLSDNDPDRDLVEILFSGLLKYDPDGKIVKDAAQDYQIKGEGKNYEFTLRDNIFWHDGKPLSAEDVAFTITLIQSPQYKSPLNVEWSAVRVETEGEKKVIFHLQKKYSPFLETIAHLKILPKHIFQDIPAENFPWTLTSKEYLVGTGPFKLKETKEDKSGYTDKIVFERNEKFYGQKPFLKKISFYFYQNFEDLLKAARVGEIDGFAVSDPKYVEVLKKEGFTLYELSLPRYFAIFFNLKDSKILNQKEIRKALSYAVNKKEILDQVFLGEGEIVNSPILADYFGFSTPSQTYEFDIEKAKEILVTEGFKENEEGFREKVEEKEVPLLFKSDLTLGSQGESVRELQKCLANPPAGGKEVYPEGEITGYFGSKTKRAVIRFQEKYAQDILIPAGLKKGTGDVKSMTRKKLNQICQEIPKEIIPLELTLTTSDKFPLVEIAEVLKIQFENIGVKVEIKKVSLGEFQTNILAKRNFEVLLFGEALDQTPDPFPFWHSSQKEYPGLNITGYQSKEADKFLEKARESFEEEEKKESLEQFQETFIKDLPAHFLVRGNYFYFLLPKIKGYEVQKITEPSKRFVGIENWYIKTRRVWK